MRPELARISIADYLVGEAKGERKHEYVDGEIYAMSGASRRHNLLASNIHVQAGWAAKRKPHCQVFGSDMKLYVEARNSVYYPDLSVCCDPEDRDERYLIRPCWIVEVLSPSTANIDRREKRMSYETLSSLREYVILDQDRMRADVYRRQAGVWLAQRFDQPHEVVECSCLDLRLSLGDIYAGVELPPAGVSEPESPDYELI